MRKTQKHAKVIGIGAPMVEYLAALAAFDLRGAL